EHVQNVPRLPQYTPNNDDEQSDILSGLLLTLRSSMALPLRPIHLWLNCWLPLLVVVYQIQPSNVELQQHSRLSNNISLTTYVLRMIISPPYLFITDEES
ncbi:hypothetical protein C0J52_18373, partial [Blattella germanica]